MLNDPIVIVGAARTPMAGFQGDFAALSASELGAAAIKAAVERAGIALADVQEVVMGNVLPAGQGQAPARQASLKAGLPNQVGAKVAGIILNRTRRGGGEHYDRYRYYAPKSKTAIRESRRRKLRSLYSRLVSIFRNRRKSAGKSRPSGNPPEIQE